MSAQLTACICRWHHVLGNIRTADITLDHFCITPQYIRRKLKIKKKNCTYTP